MLDLLYLSNHVFNLKSDVRRKRVELTPIFDEFCHGLYGSNAQYSSAVGSYNFIGEESELGKRSQELARKFNRYIVGNNVIAHLSISEQDNPTEVQIQRLTHILYRHDMDLLGYAADSRYPSLEIKLRWNQQDYDKKEKMAINL